MTQKFTKILNIAFLIEIAIALAVIAYSLLFPAEIKISYVAVIHTTAQFLISTAIFTVLMLLSAGFFIINASVKEMETGYRSYLFVYLGYFTLLTAIWIFSESGVMRVLGLEISTIGFLSYFSFQLLPVPFLFLFRDICTHGKRIFNALAILFMAVYLINFVWMLILEFNYPPTLAVVHLLILLSAVFFVIVGMLELFRYKNKDVMEALVGMVCMVGLSMTDLIRFYAGSGGYSAMTTMGVFLFILFFGIGAARRVVSSLTRAHRFETVADKIPSGIFRAINDEHMTLSYANNTFYKMYGYASEKEAKEAGFCCADFIVDRDSMESFWQGFNNNVANGVYQFDLETEKRYEGINAKWILNRINYDPRSNEIFCAVFDITDRKRMEEKIRISEEEYRIAVEQSDKFILRYEIKTKTIVQQRQSAEIFGIDERMENVPDSILQMGIVAPESVENYAGFYEAMQQGEPRGKTIVRMRVADKNQFRWFAGTFTMVYDNFSNPRHAIVSFRDITEERERELAYERFRQERQMLPKEQVSTFDCNLTRDTTEYIGGELLSGVDYELTFDQRTAGRVKFVHPEDREKYIALMDRERLLEGFSNGISSYSLEYRRIIGGGQYKWIRNELQLVQYPDSQEVKAFVVVRNIDEEKREQLKLRERSQTDSLTHSLNRETFSERVENLILNSSPSSTHAFAMLDLDNFKKINDTYGHSQGDRLLISMVENVKSILREGDLMGRMGGDEFAICLKDVPNKQIVEKRVSQICEFIYSIKELDMSVSASIGVSMYLADGASFEELYKKADIAMYKAKKNGRNTYDFYSTDNGE